jgi:hypothetical protein
MFAPSLRNPPDHAAIERRADVDDIPILFPVAVYEKSVSRDWRFQRRDRHFRHGASGLDNRF